MSRVAGQQAAGGGVAAGTLCDTRLQPRRLEEHLHAAAAGSHVGPPGGTGGGGGEGGGGDSAGGGMQGMSSSGASHTAARGRSHDSGSQPYFRSAYRLPLASYSDLLRWSAAPGPPRYLCWCGGRLALARAIAGPQQPSPGSSSCRQHLTRCCTAPTCRKRSTAPPTRSPGLPAASARRPPRPSAQRAAHTAGWRPAAQRCRRERRNRAPPLRRRTPQSCSCTAPSNRS
jgi:hypothetical protein